MIDWCREGQTFTDGRYHRRHRWSFDGGVEVPAFGVLGEDATTITGSCSSWTTSRARASLRTPGPHSPT